MGNKCGGGVGVRRRPAVEPPNEGTRLSATEVRNIIKEQLHVDDAKIFVGDREYLAYSVEKLKEFLAEDLVNKLTYRTDVLDCDDFARILQGREREWFARTSQVNCGSTLGCVWGDLRPSEDSTQPYHHAMNFFIDNERRLFMVEPQTDSMRLVTSNSTHWYVEV